MASIVGMLMRCMLFLLALFLPSCGAYSPAMRTIHQLPGRAAPPAMLVNTRWVLDIDVGQEKGSWMPPAWGRSGKRARATPIIEFAPEGRIRVVGSGSWDHLTVAWTEDSDGAVGGWSVANERATFWLEHDGLNLERDSDVTLEAGRLYGSCGAWGDLLQRRGTLTIKQRKFGWMPFLPSAKEASFIVGVFTAKPAEAAVEAT